MPGDTVMITGTGRKIDRESVNAATTILQSWGLKVLIAPTLFNEHHSYLAGTDQERLGDLQSALDNDAIRGIICARGGYGTTRIIGQLDLGALKKNPKWVAGFSDVTALHLKLIKAGVQSIHGIMPVLFTKADAHSSLETLRAILFGNPADVHAPHYGLNRPGRAQGRVTGGNLSLIVDSLGTPSEIETRDKILVIEEVNEFRYKIDRMLTQLNRAGKLQPLAGLIVGYMTGIQDTNPSFGESVEDIVFHAVRDYEFPVAFQFPVGHEHPNLAVVHGGLSTLQVTEAGAVLVQSK